MNITIVGGGNIGTQFAVHCAEKGNNVIVYTSQPNLYENDLFICDEKGNITHKGHIEMATCDPEKAFLSAELVIITVPAMIMKSIAEKIYQYTNKETIICVVPGNGGSECAFKKFIERGNIFFGLERVPAIARLKKKGRIVCSIGYRDELHISAFPKTKAEMCAEIINQIFDIRTTIVPNYLNLTMTPSNPILHTTRLYRLFSKWDQTIKYNSVPLFYEEWDNESSTLLLLCDDEVQNICHALPDFDLKYVISLRKHYESQTVEEMTQKISSIESFKGIKTPMITVDKGFWPDLHSRYFTSDFAYGLSIIQQIAAFSNVSVPTIDRIMEWYKTIAIEKNSFKYSDYEIYNYAQFKKFYL